MEFRSMLLLFSIVSTVAYILYLVFIQETYNTNADFAASMTQNTDAPISSSETAIQAYISKPKIPGRRVVIVIACKDNEDVSMDTLSSILAQTVRVDDIAVETATPNAISENVRQIVSVHKPDTTKLRETESSTIVLFIPNGDTYEPTFVQSFANDIISEGFRHWV